MANATMLAVTIKRLGVLSRAGRAGIAPCDLDAGVSMCALLPTINGTKTIDNYNTTIDIFLCQHKTTCLGGGYTHYLPHCLEHALQSGGLCDRCVALYNCFGLWRRELEADETKGEVQISHLEMCSYLWKRSQRLAHLAVLFSAVETLVPFSGVSVNC